MSNFIDGPIITGEQLKAARAMLRKSQGEFAVLTKVPLLTVRRMERTRGPVIAEPRILEAMIATLKDSGVELVPAGPYSGIGGPGVRMKGEPEAVDHVVELETAAAAQLGRELDKQA